MGVRLGEIAEMLEAIAPLRLAEDWDNVGLQVGDREWEVDTGLVSLNADAEVLEEAGEVEAQMVISHHPLIFRELKNVTADGEPGFTVLEAARRGIAIYTAHTNADAASGGASDLLSDGLGIVRRRALRPARGEENVKLVTFVPEEGVEGVRRAITEAGAGAIGNYRDCSFRTAGTGTFFGMEAAQPAAGEKGRLEEVEEWRVEVVVPKLKLAEVVRALIVAHPYETPAYDIYPLISSKWEGGLGRIGSLSEPVKAMELAQRVKRFLGLEKVKVAGDADMMVETAAVCAGGGSDLLRDAIKQGAEAYVTGDVDYHAARDAAAEGIVVIDAGHAASELPVVRWLAEQLEKRIPEVRFLVSEVEVEPFREM